PPPVHLLPYTTLFRSRIALHRGGHGADREVRAFLRRHAICVVVLEDAVDVRASGATRHELVGERAASRVERVDVSARPVDAADQDRKSTRLNSSHGSI